jgi:TorA maturation chaperone TorD
MSSVGNTNLATVLDPEDQVRADCYRVLARLFAAPPDKALLATLQQSDSGSDDSLGRLWNALCKVGAGEPTNQQGGRSKDDLLAVANGDTATSAALVSKLAENYTALFASIGEPPVMLYGSWYQTGSMMDFPLARLRTDLAKLGFAREPNVMEPEDHFAALMEVMAMLVAEDHPGQAEFFTHHIGSWYLKFCARLAAENEVASEFYRAAANFACGFLDGEAELMAP